ncbi:GTPase [Rhodococcus sp. NPDC049939]|uniref:GTPase n=1 Tax=Rhodococcus sp. NPDC049939 TaxID=3155511 RepID=UPI0033CB08B8
MEESADLLTDAVERAVRSGERELDDLDQVVASILEAVEGLEAATGSEIGSVLELEEEVFKAIEGFGEKLFAHLAKQRELLSTFNIAFFGRTGAGKSTLLSAFGELDGAYVSPGESDWTTSVAEIDWRGCRLWDTPGINGWGRTQARADLEETARRAIEVADTVLLCFDTQSQQASEFARVSEWIREYGKPSVAVLNVRNLRWRHPAKVASESARRALSQSVREHVDNVRTELSRIGLPATPIVAVQSRRALFARAATPFKGPAVANFESDRARFGVEYLSRWSNFAVLEELIVASIDEGGEELRKTALREGLRGMLESKADDLDRLTQDLEQRIDANAKRIEDLLDVLGYIEGLDRKNLLGSNGTDPLTSFESARGVRLTSAREGRLDRYVDDLLKSHLSGPREDSLRKADELVNSAFRDGKLVSERCFRSAVYTRADIDAALSEVNESASAFLLRELQLAVPAAAPVSGLSVESATVDGKTGRMKANMARAMKSTGLAAGAVAGVVVVPAVVNIWNPGGWVGTATAFGLRTVAQAGRHIGSRTAKNAERQRTREKSDALRASRKAVHQMYDGIVRESLVESRKYSWQAAAPILRERLMESLALIEKRSAVSELTFCLRQASSAIPRSDGAEEVVARARTRVLERHADSLPGEFVSGGTSDTALGRCVWLGEDWLDHTEISTDVRLPDQLQQLIFKEQSAADRYDLEQALKRAWDVDSHSAAVELARTIDDFIASDSRLAEKIGSLPDRLDGKPSVVVLGDYSSGKSSLVKRLLAELGGEVTDPMKIHGNAATDAVQTYDLGGIQLVDTPGFQSGKRDLDELALDAASGAALVLIVMHVNLLIGDMSLLEAIVNGTERTVAKGCRTIYLINRCDEFGVDPLSAPEDFLLCKRRKEAELITALGSRGIRVDPIQVHTLSGDPFGEVGGRTGVSRADFSQHRDWDGVDPLARVLDSFSMRQGCAGAAGARLDAAITSLLQVRNQIGSTLRQLRSDNEVRASLLESIENGQQDGSLLMSSIHERVRRIVETYSAMAREQVAAAGEADIHKLASTSNSWWADEGLESDLERVVSDSCREIDDWFRDHSSIIGREMESISFTAKAFATEDRFTGPQVAGATWGNLIGNAANYGSEAVRRIANRDAVYGIGKALGVKFKPWGAVNTAGKMARAAPIVAAVGMAADGYAMVKDERAEKDREKHRNDAINFISRMDDELVTHVLEGEANDGLLPYLRERTLALTEHKSQLEHGQSVTKAEIEAQEKLLSAVELWLAEGTNLRHREGGCE